MVVGFCFCCVVFLFMLCLVVGNCSFGIQAHIFLVVIKYIVCKWSHSSLFVVTEVLCVLSTLLSGAYKPSICCLHCSLQVIIGGWQEMSVISSLTLPKWLDSGVREMAPRENVCHKSRRTWVCQLIHIRSGCGGRGL